MVYSSFYYRGLPVLLTQTKNVAVSPPPSDLSQAMPQIIGSRSAGYRQPSCCLPPTLAKQCRKIMAAGQQASACRPAASRRP